jgi:L-amino acid N-acyltransferase
MSEPSGKIKVRLANYSDLSGILEIYNDAVLNTTATYDYEPRTIEHRRVWFDDHLKNGHPVFVAVLDDSHVVGWSSLNKFQERVGYRFTAQNSVYVAADHRGNGIGKALMVPLIDAARDGHFHAIVAAIDAQNEASLRLHAAFGFKSVAHLKEVGFKFGRWLDLIYMELLLPHK